MVETILFSPPFLKPGISNIMPCHTGFAQKCHCKCLIFLCCTLGNMQKNVKHTLFYKQALAFLMNWVSNVAYVLLNTFRHHLSKTLSMFSIVILMSISWSIYNLPISISRCYLTFAYFFAKFSLVFLTKVLLIKRCTVKSR